MRMMQPAKRLLLQTVRAAGVPGFFRRRNCARPVVLMFHGFTDREHAGLENCQHKHLHVAKFDAFLAHLKRHHRIIAIEELARCLREGTPPPARSVVLTFDDGFLSNYTLAFPLLKKHGAPAVVFLETEFVDEKKPIWVDRVDYALDRAGKSRADLVETKKRLKLLPQETVHDAVSELEAQLGFRLTNSNAADVPAIYRALDWSHVREMQASGLVTFGAHTHTHKILGRCQPATVEDEMKLCQTIIERETGRPCTTFCYPNGGVGDFSDATEAILKRRGFDCTITAIGGFNEPGCSPFLLKRFGVMDDMDLTQFDLLTSGVRPQGGS